MTAATLPPAAAWLDQWTPPTAATHWPAPDLHLLAQDTPPGPPINPDDLPDIAPMADAHAQALTDLGTQWTDLTDAQKQQLVDQIRDAAQRGHLTDLTNLQVDATPAAAALTAAMVAAALAASRLLAAEAADQGVTVAVQHLGPAAFQPVAQVVAQLLADELRITAARAALRTGPDATPAEVAATAQQALDDLSTASSDKQLGGTVHGAMNAARIATLRRAPEGALYASEKNDRNTCKPCREVNGRWLGNISDLDQADRHPADRTGVLALYPAGGYGGYIFCLGGINCRGTIVGVWRPAQVGDTYAKFNPEQPRRSDGKWGTGGVERELEKLANAAAGKDALDAAPAKLTRAPNGHHGDYTGEGLTGPAGMGNVRALSEYEGTEYQTTNMFLRGRYRLTDEEKNGQLPDFLEGTPERIAAIDKTMAVSKLTADVKVDRIVQDGAATFGRDTWYGHIINWDTTDFDEQDRELERWEAGDRPDLTGLRWTDAGYVSTSADPAAVERFGGRWRYSNSAMEGEPVIMTILAPKGAGGVQLSEWGHDAEILLERGLTYEVLADHGVDTAGFRRLDVTVVKTDG